MNNIELLLGALRSIAAYDDKGANERLEKTGSFGAFDEPGSVETAREALEKYDALESKLPGGTGDTVAHLLTQDQIDSIWMTAANGFGHDDPEVREEVYRQDVGVLLGHIEALVAISQQLNQPDENEMASTPGGIR